MSETQTTYRVLIPSRVAPEMLDVLRGYGSLDVDAPGDLPPEELATRITDADAVIVRSNAQITGPLIEAAPKLRVIGRAGTGLDNIDVEAATRRGIVVMNTPEANSISTAEHTLSMLLALVRRIPAADRSVKEGRWERARFQGVELLGKTLGIIGLGRIGFQIAKRARSFGIKILAHDPYVTSETLKDTSIQLVSLDELLRDSDFITVHTPLNLKTQHLISAAQIELMRPGVYILNCARGGIVDEEALCDAIEAGKVAGAALDVFEREPPVDRRVIRYDQIITTPHLGGSTAEAQQNVALTIARQVGDFLTKGVIEHAVNAYPVTGEMHALVGPYLDLCERMGSIASQLLTGPPRRVSITFHGERFRGDVEMLVASVFKGLLSVALEGYGVNFVNALSLAGERGIEKHVTKGPEREDFSNLIRVRVDSQADSHEIEGTQFGKQDNRIVSIDGFPLEMKPEGWMLFALSENYSGIIGRIGTIIGKHGGNVNKMNNGCSPDASQSLSTISLDTEPPPFMVEELLQEPYFKWIRLIHL